MPGKRPEEKHFGLRGQYVLSHNYSTLLLQQESSHGQMNKCVCVLIKLYL